MSTNAISMVHVGGFGEYGETDRADYNTGDLQSHWHMRIMSLAHAYDIIEMCAPAAPPIRLPIRTRTLTLNGIRNIRSQDYSFPGTFVPMMELSFSGPFIPWTIRSLCRSFPGTVVPGTRTFPAADRSCICQPSSTCSGTA